MYSFNFSDVINKNASPVNDDIIIGCFRYQAENCEVYKKYINLLGITVYDVKSVCQIPFLPVEVFKTCKIYSAENKPDVVFTSSSTSGTGESKHYVANAKVYETSYLQGFEYFYGNPSEYVFLALLPSYLEREGSSLIDMVRGIITKALKPSGFFLHNRAELYETLRTLKANNQKTILMGVSFALTDFADEYSINFPQLIVMETGGMKGRKEEITRQELHGTLKKCFNVPSIHSEYGMTELLSQAYSQGNGIFSTPPWMRVTTRDVRNPLQPLQNGVAGGINIIDLANINSCSFIETQDLGIVHSNGTFEITGRFDQSDIRGCNLMVI